MKVPDVLLGELDLRDSAEEAGSRTLDQFPMLIIDECMSALKPELPEIVTAEFSQGRAVVSETIAMPRRGFGGPRPVTLMAHTDRILYTALSSRLGTKMSIPERSPEAWLEHSAFGQTDEEGVEYLVDFDIASCYEYIEHPLLTHELSLQTLDVPAISSLADLLGEVFRRPRGLPQLLTPSDVLADAYLHVIERRLSRHGWTVSRYADDFKVTSASWGDANEVIESAAEMAREFGLVLSTAKTHIRKISSVRQKQAEREDFFNKYLSDAFQDLADWELQGDYGRQEWEWVEPQPQDAQYEAYRRIVKAYASAEAHEENPALVSAVGRAIAGLRTAEDRLPDDWLTQVAFKSPLQLRTVLNYVSARRVSETSWTTLLELVQMERQSPWAKLWLLHTAEILSQRHQAGRAQVIRWALRQLGDARETVRAQAAWFLAGAERISVETLSNLYNAATPLSRPAIAAAVGRVVEGGSDPLASAIQGDGPIPRSTFDWGAAHDYI